MLVYYKKYALGTDQGPSLGSVPIKKITETNLHGLMYCPLYNLFAKNFRHRFKDEIKKTSLEGISGLVTRHPIYRLISSWNDKFSFNSTKGPCLNRPDRITVPTRWTMIADCKPDRANNVLTVRSSMFRDQVSDMDWNGWMKIFQWKLFLILSEFSQTGRMFWLSPLVYLGCIPRILIFSTPRNRS